MARLLAITQVETTAAEVDTGLAELPLQGQAVAGESIERLPPVDRHLHADAIVVER